MSPSERAKFQPTDEAVRDALAISGFRFERSICIVRIGFFSLLLLRFLAVSIVPTADLIMTSLPLLAGIGFSVYVLIAVREPPRTGTLSVLSVLVDSAAVFFSLLPNALWPSDQFVGIMYLPDTAGILVATVAAGFRLSVRAAIVGGVVNTLGLVVLLAADRLVSGSRFYASAGPVSPMFIYVVGCSLLAVLAAWGSTRMVRNGALRAMEADRALQGLGTVLADSHDTRSLLTSIKLRSESLAATLEKEPVSRRSRQLVLGLRDDVEMVSSIQMGVSARAVTGVSALGEAVDVNVQTVADRVIDQLRLSHEHVQITPHFPSPEARVLMVGGEPTLHRILMNLLVNACQGRDGHVPTRVELACHRDQGDRMLRIRVTDDGPGLPGDVLDGESEPGSSKPDGLGVGLSVVRGLAEASGGQLMVSNRPEGGATAQLILPDRSV